MEPLPGFCVRGSFSAPGCPFNCTVDSAPVHGSIKLSGLVFKTLLEGKKSSLTLAQPSLIL